MSQPSLGIYFTALVRQRFSLDLLAQHVMEAMGCSLSQSNERGIVGDYVGEVLGMRLDLHVSLSDNAFTKAGTLFVFSGGSQFTEDTEVSWTNISSYVVQVLQERTGLPWYVPEQAN